MSEGRIRVVPSFGVVNGLAALRSGEADLYFASEHDNLEAHRGLAYFAGLPGDHGLNPQHLQTWIGLGGGQVLWDELAADLGVKPMLAAHTGSRSYLLATERVDAMSALAGRKAHVQGLARDVARGLGLEPVSVAPAHLAEAMRTGDVLAAECGGAITSYALGLHAAAPYWAGTSINRHGAALSLGISRALWDRLGAADQAMFAAAASAEFQLSLAEEEAHRRCSIPSLRPTKHGPWPPSSRMPFAASPMPSSPIPPAPTPRRGASTTATRPSGARRSVPTPLPDMCQFPLVPSA